MVAESVTVSVMGVSNLGTVSVISSLQYMQVFLVSPLAKKTDLLMGLFGIFTLLISISP